MRSCSRFEGFACKFLRERFFMALCQADEDDFHKMLENGYTIAVGTMLRIFPRLCYREHPPLCYRAFPKTFGPFRIECQSSGLTLLVSCVTLPRSCPFNANTRPSPPEIEFN